MNPLVKKVQTVPSSLQDLTWSKHLFLIQPTFSLRPDVVTAHSVVPVSVSGIINRNPVSSTEGESKGTAFRGRTRVWPRFEHSETGGCNILQKGLDQCLKGKEREA